MLYITRRNAIRIVSFTFASLLVAVGFAVKECNLKEYYIMQSERVYSRNFEDLSASLNNIDIVLEKVLYSASAVELGSLTAELWKEAGAAKTALSQLPRSEEELETINKFLSQVGDYSLFLAKKQITGEGITDEERENVRKLSVAARGIANSVSEAMVLYSDGYFAEEVISQLDKNYISSFGESLLEIEDTVTDYPTLIYDGPYSDHILTSVPKMTANAEEITLEEAKKIAAKAMNVTEDKLTRDSDEGGKIECYCFSYEEGAVSVTKRGGYIADYRKYKAPGETKLSYEEAVKKAEEYIEKQGYTFKSTYYFADEGMCTVNFAYYDDGITYYPDLVKVGVSLTDGELLMVEARGLISNHFDREWQNITTTVDEAMAKLSDNLTVMSHKLAVIPTGGNNEKLCYEFSCEGYEKREILVYIDVYTLEESDILILLRTDGGIMTK